MVRMLVAITLFVASTAGAEELSLRDSRGAQVEVHDQGTVMLFWSMDDAGATEQLTQLAELEAAGRDVVAVNTDSPNRKAQIRPWLARHGVTVRTAVDPTGELASTWKASSGEAVLIENIAVHRVTWRGSDLEPLRLVPAATEVRTARE